LSQDQTLDREPANSLTGFLMLNFFVVSYSCHKQMAESHLQQKRIVDSYGTSLSSLVKREP